MLSSGLGHASSFLGSDTIICIPGARYFYNEPEDQVAVYSVNASEHSVSTTKIFTVGEQQMIADWLADFPKGILSIVSDTFDLWKLITEYLPANKEASMARDGKLVIRPDSGDPVDILCGKIKDDFSIITPTKEESKGVIELLWDVFGGTVNAQGYKVLDPHIGAIYGDSITIDRANEICSRLAVKGFASTNVVLGIGSFTYQYNTRDTFGFAMKATYVEIIHPAESGSPASATEGREIFKDPITDDGTKKSATGLLCVEEHDGKIGLYDKVQWATEKTGLLQDIYLNGEFHNTTDLATIRQRVQSNI
jgi:nicotinamide phosphoribosyltransferase